MAAANGLVRAADIASRVTALDRDQAAGRAPPSIRPRARLIQIPVATAHRPSSTRPVAETPTGPDSSTACCYGPALGDHRPYRLLAGRAENRVPRGPRTTHLHPGAVRNPVSGQPSGPPCRAAAGPAINGAFCRISPYRT